VIGDGVGGAEKLRPIFMTFEGRHEFGAGFEEKAVWLLHLTSDLEGLSVPNGGIDAVSECAGDSSEFDQPVALGPAVADFPGDAQSLLAALLRLRVVALLGRHFAQAADPVTL
jgi:hypothetical protein